MAKMARITIPDDDAEFIHDFAIQHDNEITDEQLIEFGIQKHLLKSNHYDMIFCQQEEYFKAFIEGIDHAVKFKYDEKLKMKHPKYRIRQFKKNRDIVLDRVRSMPHKILRMKISVDVELKHYEKLGLYTPNELEEIQSLRETLGIAKIK